MVAEFTFSGHGFRIDLDDPIEISIPLHFDRPQPNLFDVDSATAEPLQGGGFIGSTRRGGGCNVDILRLITHCNGTHTECVGHIVDDDVSITAVLQDLIVPAALVSITPTQAGSCEDTYTPEKQAGDLIISRSALEAELDQYNPELLTGLVIRTLPNDDSKIARHYSDNPPPFFSREAMTYLTSLPVKHLIVDTPSLDRMHDDGLLTAHHLYWNVAENQHRLQPETRIDRTVSELVYVPSALPDGLFLACIQVPSFVLDAAPSRILLYNPQSV